MAKKQDEDSTRKRLPKMYANQAIAGRLRRHADELTAQQDEVSSEEEREAAISRLRLQDIEPEKPGDWISDPYYTGGLQCWPAIRDLFVEIVEGKYNVVVLRGAAGYGKCLTADAEFYDPRAGRRRRVDEVGNVSVVATSEQGRLALKDATAFPSGRKECVRLKLMSGQEVGLSNDHPVLTHAGWVPAGQLLETDLIAVPRKLPAPAIPVVVSDEEVKFVAYMMADGGCRAHSNFTNSNPEVLAEFEKCADAVAIPSSSHKKVGCVVDTTVNSGKATTLRVRGVRPLLEKHKINTLSKNKRLPAAWYGLDDRQAALFLNRFITCDGYIFTSSPRKVEVGLASRGLIEDLRFLLLRLGVLSRSVYKKAICTYQDGHRKPFDSWKLTITGVDNLEKFFQKVGLLFGQEVSSETVVQHCRESAGGTNTDVVPVGKAELKTIRQELFSKGRSFHRKYSYSDGSWMSRKAFEAFCKREDYDGVYAWFASSELAWERLRDIEAIGPQDVFDLNVPELHNFVGNGIVLHNTVLGRALAMRSTYEVGCYASPHAQLGSLDPNLPLRISMIGVDLDHAKARLFEPFCGYIKQAQWFAENFRPQSRLYNNTGVTFLQFTRPGSQRPSLRIQPDPTSVDSVVGDDLLGMHMTECNKYDFVEDSKRKRDSPVYDAATEIWDEMRVRLVTRFKSPLEPCVRVMIDSSERYEGDFIARLAPTLKDYGIPYIEISKSNWETRPGMNRAPFFLFAKPRKGVSAEVITTEERQEELLIQGRDIINIPEGPDQHYLKMAKLKPDHFSQNIVGAPTDAIDRFITDPAAIQQCGDERVEWAMKNGLAEAEGRIQPAEEVFVLGHSQINWQVLCLPDENAVTRPRVLPRERRFAHFDLATTGQDYVGFAVGCYAGKSEFTGEALIWYDLALRIQRDGKEYDFALLRKIIDDLRLHGFEFSEITFDSWQSFDFGQQLQNIRNIKVERISLHRTVDGYMAMREALYSKRLLLSAGPVLHSELVQLERRFVNNRETVEHRPGGHDDMADAVAGVCWQIEKMVAKMGGAVPRVVKAKSRRGPETVEDIHAKLQRPELVGENATAAYKAAVAAQTQKILRKAERVERRARRREARSRAR